MNTSSGPSAGWISVVMQSTGPVLPPGLVTSPPFAAQQPSFWPAAEPINTEDLLDYAARITKKPDHEWNPFPGGSYCQDCDAGNLHMDEPGAHLYIIREWEIG